MERNYGALVQGKKSIQGIWFTDGINLTFNKRSACFVVFFGLLSDTLNLGKQVLTLPIKDIESIEYFKFRLNKKAIRLRTANSTIELVCNKPERIYNLVAASIGK